MKQIFLLFFCFISISTLSQPIYTIPWATKQPKFVFPIYLENAQGQRDTIYLGYDSTATGNGVATGNDSIDAVFGVKRMPIDTNSFYAFWGNGLQSSTNFNELEDSVFKANVSPLFNSGTRFPGVTSIWVNGGTLPLKISWDISTLRSDSLPFSHPPGEPKAQGRFIMNYHDDNYMAENGQQHSCNHGNLLITDSVTVAECASRDSVTIYNRFNFPFPVKYGYFDLLFENWRGGFTDIIEIQKQDILLSPNPFTDYIKIETFSDCKESYAEVFDLYGKTVFIADFRMCEESYLNLSSLTRGIYILKLFNKNISRSFLISKY